MKKLLLFFFTVVYCTAFSQIHFEPGYIIDNSGTKKECLIRNIAWKNSPSTIEYKITENDTPKKTGLSDIKEFSVSNTYKYVRYTTLVDRSGNSVQKASYTKDPITKEETILLKVLVEGKITLYQYEDDNLVLFFTSAGDRSKAEQLIHKIYISEGGYAENNQFRQQLYRQFQSEYLESGSLKMKDFEKLNYSQKALIKLFGLYDQSETTTFTNLEARQNKSTVHLKAIAGANFTSLMLEKGDRSPEVNFENKTLFSVGFEAEYILPFNQKKWSIFIAPNWQKYESTAEQGITNSTTILKSDVSYSMIEIPVGVRHFFFLNDTARILVEAGYTTAIPLNSHLQSGRDDFNVETSGNFFIGTGFNYSRYGVELRYTMARSINKQSVYRGTEYGSTAVVLSYRIL
ncbi:hypothetical protein [Flavobacterium kingsejongi]|uniref:tRNA modification GTPase n=1 Tax=Flavobacterium kingsejongi TaxID=1678728 RepID=A0A2S1LKK6_9FLAO|nr:hypothetical protein [Flavobacterium kingsejongi]AWG24258.1 hypothetical protein FK004_02970 [Flavobacterium kingsejongi]